MNLTIEAKTSVLVGPIGKKAVDLSVNLEGRKLWATVNQLRFETSRANIDYVISLFPDTAVQDTREVSEAFEGLRDVKQRPTVAGDIPAQFVITPYDFQLENYERFKAEPAFAIFSEQGTGKTKTALDIASYRFTRGWITGLVILSIPKGVHAQWIEEQVPRHLWKSIKHKSYIWDKKKVPDWIGKETDELQIVSGNIDMIKSKPGYQLIERMVKGHQSKLMILIDESDSIKNLQSGRSKQLRILAQRTKQRVIMTGTPIAKDLTDEWAQFYFLNPDIIGHKYLTSFRAEYCIMGGFENRSVVGHRNVVRFKQLVAPYIFRATKKELNLPEKIYDSVVFDMSDTQRRMIREVKESFFSSAQGATLSVKHAATALLRIQQISNGYFIDEDGKTVVLKENPRLDALRQLRNDIAGPTVIWCRFKHDIETLLKVWPNAVTIYGENTQDERAAAKAAMLSGKATELLATAGAAGRGLDGLQTVIEDSIFHSNSFSAIDRWQAEDRTHRIGMKGTASYFDLIARGSADRLILANLRRKKNIAELALGDIMEIMESIQ